MFAGFGDRCVLSYLSGTYGQFCNYLWQQYGHKHICKFIFASKHHLYCGFGCIGVFKRKNCKADYGRYVRGWIFLSIEVRVPEEIKDYKESIIAGLSIRQLACGAVAFVCGIPTFLILRNINHLGCDIEPICNILGNVEVPVIPL